MSNVRIITNPRVLESLKAIFAPPVEVREPTWMEWDALIAAAPHDRFYPRISAAMVERHRRRRERRFGVA